MYINVYVCKIKCTTIIQANKITCFFLNPFNAVFWNIPSCQEEKTNPHPTGAM